MKRKNNRNTFLTFLPTLSFTYFLHDPQVKYYFQFFTLIAQQFEIVNNVLVIN